MRGLLFILILTFGKLSSQPCSVFIANSPEHCGQSCNGMAQANATGQGSLNYLWQPGNYTTQQITGLCPGNYSVTVTDSLGCIAIDSVTIASVPPLIVWITNVTDPSCVGCSDGCADGNASGGAPGYTFVWTPPNAVSMNFCGMSDSIIYTLCVTDANGCTVCADTSVNDPVGISEVPSERGNIEQVELYDCTGRLIWSGPHSVWLSRSISGLPPSTYFFIGSNQSGEVVVRRTIQVFPN